LPRADARDRPVDIRGVILSVMPADSDDPPDFLGRIEVRGELQDDTRYDWAIVAVTEDTKIRNAAGRPRRATFEDLEVGRVVEVYFEGPVLFTYPVQGGARLIRILE
jgi:hypothetical protein